MPDRGTSHEDRSAVRRATYAAIGFVASAVFGAILLIDGDWIPGAIIVVAAVVGLAVQIPILRRHGPGPSPPTSRPTT